MLILFQVVIKRVRGAPGTCTTGDQLQVLQNAGALGMVVIDDVQERLSFVWCGFPNSPISTVPHASSFLSGAKVYLVRLFAHGPPAF